MQFGAYSDDGDKLKDHIEQENSSWCVNNLKQSGLSASAPFVQTVQNIGVTWRIVFALSVELVLTTQASRLGQAVLF